MNYRVIIFIFLIFSFISIGMIVYTKNIQQNLVEAAGLENAKNYSDAISAFRSIYTSEVVSVVRHQGIEISHDYQKKAAIPLPATLSIMLGREIGEIGSGASVSLYSPYPFPWRKNSSGLNDAFRENAWRSLSKDSSSPYFEFDLNKNNSVLRYAVADRMRASCVDCHNTHTDSPKTDWKVGQLRGVLEVMIPLNKVISNAEDDINFTIFIYSLLSLLGIAGLIFMIKKQKQESQVLHAANNELQAALDEIQTLQGVIPICSYCYSIRDDDGAWDQMESYISRHSDAQFSHGICPRCTAKVRSDSGLD